MNLSTATTAATARDRVACKGGSPQCQHWRRPDCSTCANCSRARGPLVQASIGLRFGNLITAARAVPELAEAAAALEAACARRGEAPASWLQLEVAAPVCAQALAAQLGRATAQLDAAWLAMSAANTVRVGAGWECCLVDMLSGACARAPLDAGGARAPLDASGARAPLDAGGARPPSCTGCHPVAWGLFGELGSVTALMALSAAARFMVMTAPAVAAGTVGSPAHDCASCPEFAHTAAAGVAPRPAWLIDAWTARLHDCSSAQSCSRDPLQLFMPFYTPFACMGWNTCQYLHK